MKNKNHRLLLLLLICLGCTNSQTEELIRNEYLRLGEKSKLALTVNYIELLEVEKVDFAKLANIEIYRIDSINKLNTKIVKGYFEIDSLLSERINDNKRFYLNASSDYQQKYKSEIKADSAELKSIARRRILTQIEILENENKIYEILTLSHVDSIQMTENLWIKHRVNLTCNNESVDETFVYVSFNNGNYVYLSENPLIDL